MYIIITEDNKFISSNGSYDITTDFADALSYSNFKSAEEAVKWIENNTLHKNLNIDRI